MRHLQWWGAGLAALLAAACGQAPPPAGPADAPNFRVQQTLNYPVTPTSVYADSYNTYAGTAFTASRATDGNYDTEWGSLDGQTEATLTLSYDRPYTFDQIRLKTQPTKGSYFYVETSNDGYTWNRVSEAMSGTDWQILTRPVYGTGRYARLHWYKSGAPLNHWSVFEVALSGTPSGGGGGGTTPIPPGPGTGAMTGSLVWMGRGEDRVSTYSTTVDNNAGDGHVRLNLYLPQPMEIRNISLRQSDAAGNPTGSYVWRTNNVGNWFLAPYMNGAPRLTTFADSLGTFSGNVALDLYAAEPGSFFNTIGNSMTTTITFANGQTLSSTTSVNY